MLNYQILSTNNVSKSIVFSCLVTCILSMGFSSSAQATLFSKNTTSLAPSLDEQHGIKLTDHEAEVLYSIGEQTVNDDWSWEKRSYYSIRINSLDAARDYGRISINFNHYYSDMTLDFARVRAASGESSPISEDALQLRVTGGGQDFYSDSSELVFSLPDVAIGSIIEFQYTKKSKEIPLKGLFTARGRPYWFQDKAGQGWRGDFVHHFSYTQHIPKKVKLYSKNFAGFSIKPTVSKNKKTISRTWQGTHFAPIVAEKNMERFDTIIPYVQFSTHKNWSVIADWTWKNAQDKFTPTTELKNIVASFNLNPNATREEKLRAVYAYLQNNIRYVFAHLGRGGYEPHFANDVVNASYGDCKDQTILGVALLRILGLEAYPAVVETASGGRSDPELVKMIFDHMIIYVAPGKDGPEQWMDTTGDRTLYPGISYSLDGQLALIANGKGGKLTTVTHQYEANYARVNIAYNQPDNGKLIADVRITYSGSFEQSIRNWWKHHEDKETAIKSYLGNLLSPSPNHIAAGEFLFSENLFRPVELRGTLTLKGDENYLTSLGASIYQLNRLFGLGNSGMQIPDTRKNRYEERSEYTLYLDSQIKGSSETSLSVSDGHKNFNTPFFEFSQDGEKIDDDFFIKMKYFKPKMQLSIKEYGELYSALDNLLELKSWSIVMNKESEISESKKLAEVKSHDGAQSASYYISLAELNIDEGKFSESLQPAQRAVSLEKNNAKAWYVLGMAQGFNSMIDESSESFEKAAALGYLP